MNQNLKSTILGAAVLGLFAGAANLQAADAKPAAATGTCTEKNSCKGHGTCAGMQGGASHECKGHNGCAANERSGMTKKECAKIKGTWKQA